MVGDKNRKETFTRDKRRRGETDIKISEKRKDR
jgi:hypothetical protein